jgi:hypothetical protein
MGQHDLGRSITDAGANMGKYSEGERTEWTRNPDVIVFAFFFFASSMYAKRPPE